MNKKYMDFVPAKPQSKKVAAKKLVSEVERPALKQKPVAKEASVESVMAVKASAFSIKKEPKYGVVEDFRPKFVKTEVPKRPLSRGHFSNQQSDLKVAKAQKVKAKRVEKPVERVAKAEVNVENKATMKVPKTPFINQGKVAKRPLSKNVYEKKIEPTKEESAGPVTIIAKPEKDTKASLIVTIILTIILGAAAGTVAFLLLPK